MSGLRANAVEFVAGKPCPPPSLKYAIDVYSGSINDTTQKLLLQKFLTTSGLGPAARVAASGETREPTATEVTEKVKHFLGTHMLKDFQLAGFIQQQGLWSPMWFDETDRQWYEADETPEQAQRRYIQSVYQTAAVVLHSFLSYLVTLRTFSNSDVSEALRVSHVSIEELPLCAMLAEYLPGPLNNTVDIVVGGYFPTHNPHQVGQLAEKLGERYHDILPNFDYHGTIQRVKTRRLQVQRSQQMRLHVLGVEDGRHVRLRSCGEVSAGPASQEADVVVEFDREIASMMRRGMLVTGNVVWLSDGTCYFTEPGYVFPSWSCETDHDLSGMGQLSLNGTH